MHKVWLFQANPSDYDLLKKIPLLLGKTDDWGVKRYRKQLEVGDEVILWQAGAEAGA
jgi:hypothetical protein